MRIIQMDKQRRWTGQTHQTFYISRQLHRRGHDVLVVCQPDSALAKGAQAEGIPTLCLRMKGWRLFPGALRLARRLRKDRFDILHPHGARDHLLASIAAFLSGGPSVVRTKHNLCPIKGPLLYRWFTSHLIAVSRAARDVLLDAGVRPEKVTVLYDGTDLERFKPAPKAPAVLRELDLRPEYFVIGTAGRLGSKSKGVPTLLRAVQILKEKAPHLRCLLVGRGADHIEALAGSLALDGRAIFTGFRQDIPAVLSVMDLYVQPSVRDALASSVLEAMAMGKPVAATRVGGMPEMVVEGETGQLCESENPAALADIILEMMNHPDRLKAMGQNARARVEQLFGLDRMMDELEQTYRAVVRTAGGMKR